eukprot:scaffold27683_cov59-Attheya_sp.AAC.1
MQFWWLVDQVEQGKFRIVWAPGKLNLTDYHTKKHPASHHTKVRPIYLYIKGKSPSLSQGCDKILTSGNTTQPRAQRALPRVDFYDKLRQASLDILLQLKPLELILELPLELPLELLLATRHSPID